MNKNICKNNASNTKIFAMIASLKKWNKVENLVLVQEERYFEKVKKVVCILNLYKGKFKQKIAQNRSYYIFIVLNLGLKK